MVEYLKSDSYGKTIVIPVIKLDRGLYMIGFLRYNLSMDEDIGLVGSTSGLSISDMIKRIHEK